MILINNVFLPIETTFEDIGAVLSTVLKVNRTEIIESYLHKKSIDARKKEEICLCCSFRVKLNAKLEKQIVAKNKNADFYIEEKYNWNRFVKCANRPVVVGFGPAGMFAALLLARSGLNPIVIERGDCVENRIKKVNEFFGGGALDTESNIQFGEGGAGTFSDGKLNTGIKNKRCRTILETFNSFGAPENILYDAKPHIGTDILVKIVRNIRNEIISLGGQILFNTKLESIIFEQGKVKSVILSNKDKIISDRIILATGHSARDVFSFLKENNISLERKPFAMGVRIEHLQEDINKSLYGKFWNKKELGAASYKLAVHLSDNRSVYTFCMCPGGYVVNASSEENSLAVNGMSNNARDGINANSALLVNVLPSDIEGDDVLGGCILQQEIERKAYKIGGGSVPITTVGNLLYNKTARIGKIKPTVKPATVFANIDEIYPDFITKALKEAIPLLDNKLKGFADEEAVITAPETRSSSPVRIIRNGDYESVSISGLYPCGEGAGYAGGIVSAAVDGLMCAEALIKSII